MPLAAPDLFPAPPRPANERLVAVALENALDKPLTYAVPRLLAASIAVGQRVRVPLGRGNTRALGYVVGLPTDTDVPPARLKSILAIEDDRVLTPPALLELARWMSRYYICPLGTVLESVIPAAVKKRIGLGYSTMARLAVSRERLQALVESKVPPTPPKRRALYARLLQLGDGEEIELLRLASEASVKVPTARKLVKAGVIILHQVADLPALELEPTTPAEQPHTLNPDQAAALAALQPRLGAGFSTTLLMGVTGSGKTEIYLQAIRQVVDAGKQAIVLVPEIALTPQTVRRFTARFSRVAYLHSGLTATQRHRQWQTILSGKADVVIGARSAIFAPVPQLGIVVVDEEHESSYKQDNAPRYHARDLAIKRAQLEACPCLLASATPSLESYVRALGDAGEARHPQSDIRDKSEAPRDENGPNLLRLPRRVRGLAMPAVELLDLKLELRLKRGPHLISSRLEHLLKTTLEKGQQAILLLNRRGYSNFIYCASCQEAIECKYCDATLTYHRNKPTSPHPTPKTQYPIPNACPPTPPAPIGASHKASLHTGQMHCHYCLAVNPLPEKCPTCGKLLSLFGLGTQRVEEELVRKFPGLAYARVDSDTMRSGRDYEKILAAFGAGEIKVLLGTQMIAKGLDYPNVTLVGVISADTALSLPDFRAAERTFQLITQVAGRAGRGDAPGRVVLQTFLPDDPTIRSALQGDYAAFAARELEQRQALGYPPYGRLARIVYRDQDEAKHQALATKLADGLRALLPAHPTVRLKGPMPCAINRIAGYHRGNILLMAPTPTPLQSLLAQARAKSLFGQHDHIAVDVDPISLL